MPDTALDHLAKLVNHLDTCMLVSDDAGTLRARPMHPVGDVREKMLYFFSYADSEKHAEIRDDSAVNLSYCDGKHTWISLSGLASTIHDRDKADELWETSMKTWFPDGLDTEGMCLIKVRLTQAEYWDQPNQTMVHLWGVAKATLTGETPVVGEHEEIKL